MNQIYIDPVLYEGRPLQCAGRQKKETECYDFLDALGIGYIRAEHDATDTIEACRGVDALLEVSICKNLLLCNRQKSDFYLLVMPGEKRFDTKTVSAALGVSRLSFADGSYMEKFLHTAPGSLSILGLMYDGNKAVHLLLDREILSRDFFGMHPCVNTVSLKISTEALWNKLIPALGHTPILLDL